MRQEGKLKINTRNITLYLGSISVVVFVAIQLVTNSILTPLGEELQQVNNEKNALVEENRILNQKIAKSGSISVIKNYAGERFDLENSTDSDSIFVSGTQVQAATIE